MKRTTLRNSAAVIAGLGLLAGASGALGMVGTMPAASPVGGNDGNQMQFTVPAAKLLQKKAVSYFYMSNGGGKVTLSPTTFKGFDSFQTATITPPSGQTILQGMSTISGGDFGSMVITNTASAAKAYTIKLKYPGSQGAPGKLTFRLQLLTP